MPEYFGQTRYREKRLIHFIDNEAAKSGLIKGTSPSKWSNEILDEFWQTESDIQCQSWFCRVPSPSNISDDPSRLEYGPMKALGGERFLIEKLMNRWV